MNFFLWILIGVLGRIASPIPDFTPITTLCLFAPTVFSKRESAFVMGSILLLSDFLLHLLFHYPIFGSWTIFTYSGWFVVFIIGFLFEKKITLCRTGCFSSSAAVIFWTWTNFGTFLTTHLYAHNWHGLLQCYIAALPFLRNSLISAMAWGAILFCAYALPKSVLSLNSNT